MQTLRTTGRMLFLALCVSALAACAPEGDPVGITAIPTDIAAFASADRPETHGPDHELVECQAMRARDEACEERCQSD